MLFPDPDQTTLAPPYPNAARALADSRPDGVRGSPPGPWHAARSHAQVPNMPGERCAGHRMAARGSPFSAEPIGPWSLEKCHQLVRFSRLKLSHRPVPLVQIPGLGTAPVSSFVRHGPIPHTALGLGLAQLHLQTPPNLMPFSQPTHSLQPLGRQLIPKTHGRFILAQASHCGSSPSSADPPRRRRTMATLTCVTLLFAVVSGLNIAPQHVRTDAAIGPPPRCRRARATREHARYRWRRSELCLMRLESGAGKGGSQIDLIHVSDVQLTDF